MHWSREELLIAFALYCRIPFGKFHQSNPELKHYAKLIGRTTSALAMKLSNIASLDPAFIATGRRGLRGASAADREMWNEMESDWNKFVTEIERALGKIGESLISGADNDVAEHDVRSTEKTVSVKARVGQEFFRKAVLSAYDNKCCISGLSVPQLLVASHIKPWSKDPANRLNPQNGLALSALHDKAFDLGIITVDDDLRVRVTKRICNMADTYFRDAICVFDGKNINVARKFQPLQEFLFFHRTEIYEKTHVFG